MSTKLAFESRDRGKVACTSGNYSEAIGLWTSAVAIFETMLIPLGAKRIDDGVDDDIKVPELSPDDAAVTPSPLKVSAGDDVKKSITIEPYAEPKLQELYSELGALHANLSYAYHEIKDYSTALTHANKSLVYKPRWSRAHLRAAQAYYSMGDIDALVKACQLGVTSELAEKVSPSAFTQFQDRFIPLLRATKDIALQKFVVWLEHNGATFPGVEVRTYGPEYRGVHSNKVIPKRKIAFQIPIKLLVTKEIAAKATVPTIMTTKSQKFASHQSNMACFLLEERSKGDASFWKPYIDILPREYTTMVHNFTTDDFKLLKGTFIHGQCVGRRDLMLTDYKLICQHMPEFATKYTEVDWLWAYTAVISRVFAFKVNGVDTEGIVPMADMLNHNNPPSTEWQFNDSLKSFTVTSTRQIETGEEILDSYGLKGNNQLLMYYGFCLESNACNDVLFSFGEGHMAKQCKFTVNPSDPSSQESIAHLRILALDAKMKREQTIAAQESKMATPAYLSEADQLEKERVAELKNKQKAKDDKARTASMLHERKNQVVSLENELIVLQSIALACSNALKQYDTTLDQDNLILIKGNNVLTTSQRNCILLRRGEKIVHESWIKLNNFVMSLVSATPKARKTIWKLLKQKNLDVTAHYLEKTFKPLLD